MSVWERLHPRPFMVVSKYHVSESVLAVGKYSAPSVILSICPIVRIFSHESFVSLSLQGQ